jgi:hypothetical protein
MSYIDMIIYDAVDDMATVSQWADQEEYRKAEEFLTSIGASRIPPKDASYKAADFYLANEAQLEALRRYRDAVVAARPRTGPPRLDMEYYLHFSGVHGTIRWVNEDEYQQARKFLVDIGLPPISSLFPRYETAEFFYFETRKQWQTFLEFRKSIEEKREK